MRIISASRRTDLPAFYSRWFMERIRAGFCHFTNPFSGQVYRVSLRPDDVTAIVFWTRNATPMLPYFDDLYRQGYRFYFQYTITGYPRVLEEAVPPLAEAVDAFRRVADAISPELVQWRYDPILISKATPESYHLERFNSLSRGLEGYTRRCYISFAQLYGKTMRNLKHLESSGVTVTDPQLSERLALANDIAKIAASRGISLYSCCNSELVTTSEDVEVDGKIKKASCVDTELVKMLRPDLHLEVRGGPTREGCGCAESTDIGAFDTCMHGCQYCYATTSSKAARDRFALHDPKDTILYRPQSMRSIDLGEIARPLAEPRTRTERYGRLNLFGE